jgi:hypothetical protein
MKKHLQNISVGLGMLGIIGGVIAVFLGLMMLILMTPLVGVPVALIILAYILGWLWNN